MRYELHDSHGMPQCGCEVLSFETLGEVIELIEEDAALMERIDGGYATIVEVIDEEEYSERLAGWLNELAGERS